MEKLWDRESRRLAFHEAGHAIAAALCATQWTSARIVPGSVGLGCVLGDPTPEPVNRTFVAWAGLYAEARSCCEADDPRLWWNVSAAQDEHGYSDMPPCWRYWVDPAEAPHETPQGWAAEIELAWPQVELLAKRLLRELTVYSVGGEAAEAAAEPFRVGCPPRWG